MNRSRGSASTEVFISDVDDWNRVVGELPDDELVVNMGPQHPSTHGPMRFVLTLEGETVTEVRQGIGYLHTGIEKNMELRSWTQGVTFCTRMDYLSPFYIEAIRTRKFPLVGNAGAVWSFLHVEDAASAAVAALTAGLGVYNIVDDHPVPIGEWLIEIARITGSPEPRRVPTWIARIAGGRGLVHVMTQARGSSNAKARRELRWAPDHPDWKTGFETELRPPVDAS